MHVENMDSLFLYMNNINLNRRRRPLKSFRFHFVRKKYHVDDDDHCTTTIGCCL